MKYDLIPMTEAHREPVMRIFNHYVENSFAAYFDAPLPPAFFDRFLAMTQGYPALVALAETGEVAGFGFLHAYHPAPTFSRTAELSYFIAPEHMRRGIGGLMLARFVAAARGMGVDNLLASISSRNVESLAFHTKHGFVEAGRLRAVGRKCGEDFDVVWMQRRIAPVIESAA